MAVYVLMLKQKEDREKVTYKFGPNENNLGIIEFNKKTKDFNVIETVCDIVSSKAYERWAAEHIVKIMYRENGIFPERMSVEK